MSSIRTLSSLTFPANEKDQDGSGNNEDDESALTEGIYHDL